MNYNKKIERAVQQCINLIDKYKYRQPNITTKRTAKILSVQEDLQACKILVTFTQTYEVECPIIEKEGNGKFVMFEGYRRNFTYRKKKKKPLTETQKKIRKAEKLIKAKGI